MFWIQKVCSERKYHDRRFSKMMVFLFVRFFRSILAKKYGLFLFKKRSFNDLVHRFTSFWSHVHTICFDLGFRNGSALDKVPSPNLRKLYYSNLRYLVSKNRFSLTLDYSVYSMSYLRYSTCIIETKSTFWLNGMGKFLTVWLWLLYLKPMKKLLYHLNSAFLFFKSVYDIVLKSIR